MRIIICSFIIFFALSCNKKIQQCSSIRVQNSCPKIYEVVVDGSEKSMKYLAKKKFEQIKFVNGNLSIDPENNLVVNEYTLKKQLRILFPNKNDCGIAVYDWEGDPYKQLLRSKKGTKDFATVEAVFIKAIKIGKAFRPNVKFGYYLIPFREYWERDEKWKENNRKIENLLKEVDILFPSIYDFYCDKDLENPEMDYPYVEDNVKLALELAEIYELAVIPFIWHRYHNSNKVRSLGAIELSEFKKHAFTALSTQYKGKSIDGIAWWAADRYYYDTKVKPILQQQASYRSFDNYYDKLIYNYGKALSDLIQEFCPN